MPKAMHINPALFRKAATLSFPEIPVHAYAKTLQEERERRGDAALREALRHMMVIREFETMLSSFKSKGAYHDVAYAYKGPAHLSIGQAIRLKPPS